jgi:hypothetical protein
MNIYYRPGSTRRGLRLRAWLPALVMLAASFSGLTWMELQPRNGQFVAAVFPLWWSAARSTEAVALADGAVIGWGGLPSIIVTRSDQADFAARLYAAGAILLVDPTRLGSCAGRGPTIAATTGRIET